MKYKDSEDDLHWVEKSLNNLKKAKQLVEYFLSDSDYDDQIVNTKKLGRIETIMQSVQYYLDEEGY